MRKAAVLSILVVGAACCWSDRRGAAAEESPSHRISIGDRISDSARIEAIQRALRELGYIEGQNIAIEYRYAEGKRGRDLSSRPSWCDSKLISSW